MDSFCRVLNRITNLCLESSAQVPNKNLKRTHVQIGHPSHLPKIEIEKDGILLLISSLTHLKLIFLQDLMNDIPIFCRDLLH